MTAREARRKQGGRKARKQERTAKTKLARRAQVRAAEAKRRG